MHPDKIRHMAHGFPRILQQAAEGIINSSAVCFEFMICMLKKSISPHTEDQTKKRLHFAAEASARTGRTTD